MTKWTLLQRKEMRGGLDLLLLGGLGRGGRGGAVDDLALRRNAAGSSGRGRRLRSQAGVKLVDQPQVVRQARSKGIDLLRG